MSATAIEIRRDIAKMIRPPERITVTEAANRYVNVRTASGGIDKWDESLTPYMVEPMNCLTSRNYSSVIFVGPAQSGKALALDTPIPTPTGWTTMGDISVGDTVFDDSGNPVEVDFITQPMLGHECYRVTFSDGEIIIADAEHLWTVTQFNRDGTLKTPAIATLETQNISTRFKHGQRNLFAVENAKPLTLRYRDLPIDPYVLGLWLGDGDSNHSRITTSDLELVKYIEQARHTVEVIADNRRENLYKLIIDRKLVEGDICFRGHDKRIIGTTSTGNCLKCNYQNRQHRNHGITPDVAINKHDGLSTKLRRLGVLVEHGCGKHIPIDYLRASYDQRLALLQGLMDSDGTCSRSTGSCSYTSVQKELADGVYELLMTLGVKARVRNRQTCAYSNGQAKKGKPSWTIDFHVYDNFPVFRLTRKRGLLKPKNCLGNKVAETSRRRITCIEKVASVPVKCIRVKNESHLFLAGKGMIPTHNTQGLITNFMAYVIKCDPADFMIMQTTKGTARDFDTQVVKRAFRDSPELKKELAPGSKSDNTYDKVFKSGAILFQRWPSINELSGKPLKYVLITDYDRMTQNIDGEGSPFSLAGQRTAKFLSRGMTLVETSPGFEITDPKHKTNFHHESPPCGGALSLFNMGDMRRWYVQCPECGEFYMPPPAENGLDFVHDRDLFGATETAITRPVKFVCTANGCLIDVSHKRAMNDTGLWVPQGCTVQNGKVVGEPIKSSIASFWFPGIFAAYSNPEALVEKYLKGHREYDITGSEQNLKTTVNVNFGAAYLPRKLAELEAHAGLSDRAEPLDRYYVPDQARVLLASVDIQNGKDSRFVVEVHAVGVGLEQWIVDRFELAFIEKDGVKRRVNPGSNKEDWDLLTDKVISASYKTHNGRKMMVHLTAIDTGGEGDTTHNAYQFYRRLKKMGLSSKVILVKGGSGKNETPIIRSYGKDQNKREMKDVPIYLLATDFFKDIVSSILRRTMPGGMYLHFSKWLSEEYYDELQAEIRNDNGKWEKIRSRNESLDLNVYILACCWKLGINSEKFDWINCPSWAVIQEANSNVIAIEDARMIRAQPTETLKKPKRNSQLL